MGEVNRWLAGVLVLIGVASIGTSLKTSNDTGETNDCLANFITENRRVSGVRAEATAERDAAIDGALVGIDKVLIGVSRLSLAPDPDPAKAAATYKALLSDYRTASKAYRQASAKVARSRAENPLPDVPGGCK